MHNADITLDECHELCLQWGADFEMLLDGTLRWTRYGAGGVKHEPPAPRRRCVGGGVERLHKLADDAADPTKVYFIGGARAIKIGFSISPHERLRKLQLSSPAKLTILALTTGGALRERAYHAQFTAHRLHGEWFDNHPEIREEIRRLRAGSADSPLNQTDRAPNLSEGSNGNARG